MQTVLRYPVDVFGTGWDHIPWEGARAAYHGAMNWRGTMQQLPRYLGCLSINPLVDESVHDRVFFALSTGVTPISDVNTSSRQRMPGLGRYTFAFGSDGSTRDGIEQTIDAVLSDPADALARSDAAGQTLEADFSLRRSAQQIVSYATLHPMNAPAGL
jgi:hypothetical protein